MSSRFDEITGNMPPQDLSRRLSMATGPVEVPDVKTEPLKFRPGSNAAALAGQKPAPSA